MLTEIVTELILTWFFIFIWSFLIFIEFNLMYLNNCNLNWNKK